MQHGLFHGPLKPRKKMRMRARAVIAKSSESSNPPPSSVGCFLDPYAFQSETTFQNFQCGLECTKTIDARHWLQANNKSQAAGLSETCACTTGLHTATPYCNRYGITYGLRTGYGLSRPLTLRTVTGTYSTRTYVTAQTAADVRNGGICLKDHGCGCWRRATRRPFR